ncbi:MAG: phosphonate ABC transporter, permease protein PhnE [Spirochaetales bacterium]|nr:phosphonate ABC transporter, permease protein PhnE [Spirochaetales bacterium]
MSAATKTKEKKPLISPVLSLILSIPVPGLGQLVSGKIRRGLLLIGSFATLAFLYWWRLKAIGHRQTTLIDIFKKALQLNGLFTVLLLIGLAGLYAWILVDAFKQAKKSRPEGTGIFFLILFLFFAVGWQISQIEMGKLTSRFSEAWVPLKKILWPWDAAITYEKDVFEAAAQILVDSDEAPPPVPEQKEGEPYLVANPTYGNLSRLDENNKVIPGSRINLKGSGFKPETLTQIWWADSIGNEFRPRQEGQYVTVITDKDGAFEYDLIMPYRLTPPSAVGLQYHEVMARQIFEKGRALPSEPLILTVDLIIETIFMGMMATFFGIILSIPVSFLAARNLMSSSWITVTIYYVTRTILNIIRSIEPLIWALIAVVWVGLGPFAGIVALTIHSVAALAKLYSEAIENIDPGPIEAIQATGATKLQVIRYAVVPQMIPPFVSFTIYRWDINVRMSTVIGMVGGGGIGFLLVQYIRLLDYKSAGIAVWFIAVTVSILDYVSANIRKRFI